MRLGIQNPMWHFGLGTKYASNRMYKGVFVILGRFPISEGDFLFGKRFISRTIYVVCTQQVVSSEISDKQREGRPALLIQQ